MNYGEIRIFDRSVFRCSYYEPNAIINRTSLDHFQYKEKSLYLKRSSLVRFLFYLLHSERERSELGLFKTSRDRTKVSCSKTELVRYSNVHCSLLLRIHSLPGKFCHWSLSIILKSCSTVSKKCDSSSCNVVKYF